LLTNYLMLEMGQPMHAFDSRKVGKIRIRRFDKPFTFQTLDGVERNIDENTLMICNDETPVAIAGIMGGLDSEIVEDTTTLTLESATFDAASIRKSTVRLSHRTDASMRYEKCLDPEMTVPAVARFIKLLQDIDPESTVVSALTDEYAYHYDTVELNFDKAFVDKYTGIDIDNETIIETLTSLGFTASVSNDDFDVVVPSWRATKDVTMNADIIEEITRIYGYDNFDVHTTRSPLYPVRPYAEKTLEDKIKDLLVKRFSLHELHSYVWAYYDELKALGIDVEGEIKLVNATNPNIETIRKSIIPTQLCQVKINTSFATDFGIFEIGRVVSGIDENNLCIENKKLAVTLFSKTKSVPQLYFELRDMIEIMVSDLRHKAVKYEAKKAVSNYQHPRNLNSIIVDDKKIGEIGIVHPVVSKKIDKKASIVFAELDVNLLAEIENASIQYEEPSKFPAMDIDLSFVSDKFAPIARAIENAKCPLIKKVEVTDVYEDDNSKSITTRITFAHPERTLTREEVQAVADSIIGDLKSKGISLKS
ncbi:MAG: phenylalanine--tRNA ligase subunit beta, partial [Eubacterium sp.]